MDTDKIKNNALRRFRIPWIQLIIVMAVVATYFVARSEPGLRARERVFHRSYVDQMELEEGDIRLERAGAHIRDGVFRIVVLLDHEIPLYPEPGVDESQFNVAWDVAVAIDGQRVHEAKFEFPPTLALVLADSLSPMFGDIQEYIEHNAKLSLAITQQGREIVRIDGEPLEELQLKDLSAKDEPKKQESKDRSKVATGRMVGGIGRVRLTP